MSRTKAQQQADDAFDFVFVDGGTIFLLNPVSEAAKAWVADHIPEDAQWLGPRVAVEHRYIGAIIEGIQGDGLSVAREY